MDGIKISQGLGLQDFDLIRVIGRGSYAKVLLVRLKKNDQIYAMKVVKKELVHDDEVRRCGATGGGPRAGEPRAEGPRERARVSREVASWEGGPRRESHGGVPESRHSLGCEFILASRAVFFQSK